MIKHYMKQYTIELSELMFYVFFCSLLFAKGIGLYDGQAMFKVFLLTALVGWVCKQLLTKYSMAEMIGCILLIVLGGVLYLNTHEKGALFCILLITGMKGINLRRTFQVGLVTWIFSFGGLFFLSAFHIIDSSFKVHDKLGMGRIIRWNLGYAHPNVLHISYLVLVCFIVYLLGNRFKLRHFLLLEAVNLYVFMYSLSSTGFFAASVCLCLALYWSLRKKFCKVEQLLIQLWMPACVVFSLLAPVTLREPLFGIVDRIVNTRLSLSQWFLSNQPAKLLGVDTREIVTSLRTMDNSYVFAFITHGILFFVLMVMGYMVLIYSKTRKQDGVALCLILSCLVAGITEPFLFNTSFKNLSLLFLGDMLLNRESEAKEYSFFARWNKTICIPIPDIKRLLEESIVNAKKYRKKLIIASIAIGIICAVIGYTTTKNPARYILPRTAFEYTNDIPETYYLTAEDDVPQTGDLVMGYINETTDMVPFTGNITVVERFRNTVSFGLIAVLLTYVTGSIYLQRRDLLKSMEQQK